MVNRYRDIKQFKTSDGVTYTTNPIYPEIAPTVDDMYVISTGGDRYDTLASQFYGDYSLWWIIASANTSQRASLIVQPGVQLRIPANKDKIIDTYNTLNRTR